MNLWLKANPSFDNDDTLEAFLNSPQGLLFMFDGPARYNYQDLPKFLIYVLQMYMNKWGDKPMVPYIVFGKQQKISEGQENNENRKSKICYKKLKRPSWRETKIQKLNKNGTNDSM